MFNSALTRLGLALEETPYDYPVEGLLVDPEDETQYAANYNFNAYNIKVTPEFEEYKRQRPSYGTVTPGSLIGKRSAKVTFSVDFTPYGMHQSGICKLLKSCRIAQRNYMDDQSAVVGVGFRLSDSCSSVPAVINVTMIEESMTSGIVYLVRGAMGTVKFMCDGVGKPVRMDFEYTGVLQAIQDVDSDYLPTFNDGIVYNSPPIVMGTNITFASFPNIDCDKFSIDIKNKVELYPDPSCPEGYLGAKAVGNAEDPPYLTLDPYLSLIYYKNYWSSIVNSVGPVLFTTTVGPTGEGYDPDDSFQMIFRGQIVKGYDMESRNSMAVNSLGVIMTYYASAGNNFPFEILIGSKTTNYVEA